MQYAWYNDIFLPQHLSLELIGFLSASYFLGIVIRDFSIMIFPSLIDDVPKNYKSILIFFEDFVNKCDNRVINLYERDLYILIVTISIGSSSLFGGVLMMFIALSRKFFKGGVISENYILLTLSMIILGVIMLIQAKKEARHIEKERNFLADIVYRNNEKKKEECS